MVSPLRKSERVVVVPYRPRRNLCLAIVAVLCIVLSCITGFLYSAARLEFWRADLLGQRETLIEQLLNASETLEEQQTQLATISMGANIDRQAAEALKVQLVQQQKTVSGLNEELSFYRNLMNPKAGQSGLDAYRFLVYGLSDRDQLRYRLVLQQLGTGQKLITVSVKVKVLGTTGAEPAQLALQDLLVDKSAWRDNVKFRYYHDLEGQFTLPEGFIPTQFEVVLTQSRKASTTHLFEWELLE